MRFAQGMTTDWRKTVLSPFMLIDLASSTNDVPIAGSYNTELPHPGLKIIQPVGIGTKIILVPVWSAVDSLHSLNHAALAI